MLFDPRAIGVSLNAFPRLRDRIVEFDEPSRVADDDGEWSDVFGDEGIGSDNGASTHGEISGDHCACAEPAILFDDDAST